MDVSIHAPTRGATVYAIYLLIYAESFNPRTHAGCDGVVLGVLRCGVRFNPRTHAGCDVSNLGTLRSDRVSIHAPTRGATWWEKLDYEHGDVSIHAPTRGATLFPIPIPIPQCFNPRTHAGCDTFAQLQVFCNPKFQSTHPRGVRRQWRLQ